MADRTYDNVKLSVAFSQAASLANLASGENISTSFGKISKFIASIQHLVSMGTQMPAVQETPDHCEESGLYYVDYPSQPAYVLLVHRYDDRGLIDQFRFSTSGLSMRSGTIVSGAITNWSDWEAFASTTDLSNKQAKLVVGTNLDSAPTDGSNNPVTSNGVYDALTTKQDTITFDGTYNASTNPAATISSIVDKMFGLGTRLTASDDLDTLRELSDAGIYYWYGGSSFIPANSPAISPITGDARGGKMIVFPIGPINASGVAYTVMAQIIFPTYDTESGGLIYFRTEGSSQTGAWNRWQTFCSGNGGRYGSTGANMNNFTQTARMHITNASSVYSMLNTPLNALGINTSNGAITIDGHPVTAFNASALIDVVVIDTNRIEQTIRYIYNSANTGNTTNDIAYMRNWCRTRYFKRVKDQLGWSNWYMYVGTEIVPPST